MRRVNPEYFVSSDTKCKQRTPTTSKLSAERRNRFFTFLDAVVRVLDTMETSGQAFQFDEDSEQFLATTLSLRKHLTHLVTTIKAEQHDRVEQVVSETPRQTGARPENTSLLLLPQMTCGVSVRPLGTTHQSQEAAAQCYC
jgi:hypothetical protein